MCEDILHPPPGLDYSVMLYPFYSHPNDFTPANKLNPSKSTSLAQIRGNLPKFDDCMAIVSEFCRLNDPVSQALELLIKGSKLNLLSRVPSPVTIRDKVEYNVHRELDVLVPSVAAFEEYLVSSITDQFYIHKNEALKKMESDLKFRECVLVNELDILFFNSAIFPLNISRNIHTFKMFIMDGFRHLTHVAFNKLQAIWAEIEKSDLSNLEVLIGRFTRAHEMFEKDLGSGLKFIIEHSVYSDILRHSSSYAANYSRQLASNPKGMSRMEIELTISDSCEFIKRLSIILGRQCQQASVYGPQAAQDFFKSAEGAIGKI